MKIESFREILLRKSSEDTSLKSFIHHMSDEHLVRYVDESLNKMAFNKEQSKKTNPMVMEFASDLATNGNLPKMMYDHLSHHATRYKAALKAGLKDVAGQHMRKIFNNLYLTQKMIHDGSTNHTDGAIDHNSTKWVDPKPWERHRYSEMHPSGKFKSDTEGVKRNFNSAPFYDYLEKQPHHSYSKEIHSHGHNKAWPLEEIKFNGKHIHIDDDHQSKGEFEHHELDSHPIMDYRTMTMPSASINSDALSAYSKKSQDFMDKHLSGGYTPMQVKNPEIGSKKSSQVHEDVAPLDTSHLVRQATSAMPSAESATAKPAKPAMSSKTKSATSAITADHISKLNAQMGEKKVKEILGEDVVNEIMGKK